MNLGTLPTATGPDGRTYDAVASLTLPSSTAGIPFGSDFWTALGLNPDAFITNKVGRDPSVSSGDLPEDVWEGGGVYTGFPTGAAENAQAFSSSALDTGTLTLQCLDADWNRSTRTVTLTGTTPVTIPGGTVRRIHSANYDNGTASGFNAGTITVRHATTTANVFQTMLPGLSQTNAGCFTIPAGYTGLLLNTSGAVRGTINGVLDGQFWIRQFGKSPTLRRPFTISPSSASQDWLFGGLVLPEKTDIIPRITAASVNNVEVTMKFDILVTRNPT